MNNIAELRAALQEFLECARIDPLMSGPRLSGWNRSALDRCWAKYHTLLNEDMPCHPSTKS